MTQPSLFDEPLEPDGRLTRVPDDVARARRTDPGTSHQAAASVDEITRKQAAVLRLFEAAQEMNDGGLTDATLVTLYQARAALDPVNFPPQSTSGLRTRRSELVAKQRLRDSGARVKLTTGRLAIVWAVVP